MSRQQRMETNQSTHNGKLLVSVQTLAVGVYNSVQDKTELSVGFQETQEQSLELNHCFEGIKTK